MRDASINGRLFGDAQADHMEWVTCSPAERPAVPTSRFTTRLPAVGGGPLRWRADAMVGNNLPACKFTRGESNGSKGLPFRIIAGPGVVRYFEQEMRHQRTSGHDQYRHSRSSSRLILHAMLREDSRGLGLSETVEVEVAGRDMFSCQMSQESEMSLTLYDIFANNIAQH